jgi:DNA-binding FrmR family transcriptional regulator
MGNNAASSAAITERLKRVTGELNTLEQMLVSEQQYLDCHTTGEQSAAVLALLENERARVTYRLCRVLGADLANGHIDHSQLVQLYLAAQDLAHQLGEKLGREGAARSPQSAQDGG